MMYEFKIRLEFCLKFFREKVEKLGMPSMPVRFSVDSPLEELEESGGFGAWITIEVNGKRIVWAACYILQAISGILATVTFTLASCDEIPYVLEKFGRTREGR